MKRTKSVFLQKVHFRKRESVVLLVGFLSAMLGVVCNTIARAAYGGKMPVLLTLEYTLFPSDSTHAAIYNSGARLIFLADIFPLGKMREASIGDILIWLGILIWYISATVVAVRMFREAKAARDKTLEVRKTIL